MRMQKIRQEKLKTKVPGVTVEVYPLEDSQKLYEKIKESDILVNATKSGMKPAEDESLIKDVSVFRTDFVVADAVYNPRETKLIREAKAAGCKIALGGIGMLLWQGEAAFRIFTGESMPTEEVYERFFEDKEKRIPGNMEYDIEQIRNELGKGMNIEKIAEKLNLDQAYVEFLFWFGIL